MANECYVTLTGLPRDKEILVAKTLSRILGFSLKEARTLLNSTATPPSINNISQQDAAILQQELDAVGVRVKIDESLAEERDKLTLDGYYFTIEKMVTDSQRKHQCQEDLIQVVNRQMPDFDRGAIEKLADDLSELKIELTNTEKKIEYLKNAKVVQVLMAVIAAGITAIISHNPIATLVAVLVVFGVFSAISPRS
jgi:DNA-binding transcriptional MerR regulator